MYNTRFFSNGITKNMFENAHVFLDLHLTKIIDKCKSWTL